MNNELEYRGVKSPVHTVEHKSEIELAPADQQPWLNWRGGNCPVQEGVIVEVTLRDTRTSKHKLNAQGYKWKHSNRDDDIIEYRVIGIADGWELTK